MTIAYLWHHRRRHSFFSRSWVKDWAKRALNVPGLLNLLWSRWWLIRGGATVGSLTVVGKANITGHRFHLRVGEECAIGRVTIPLHADVHIGNRVAINDHVTILTASHDVMNPNWQTVPKITRVDDYAWIAHGAMLLPGVHIGTGAVVGAGAVVSRDVPPYAIVAGNPAIVLAKRRTEYLNYSPVQFIATYEAWLGRPPRHCANTATSHPQ